MYECLEKEQFPSPFIKVFQRTPHSWLRTDRRILTVRFWSPYVFAQYTKVMSAEGKNTRNKNSWRNLISCPENHISVSMLYACLRFVCRSSRQWKENHHVVVIAVAAAVGRIYVARSTPFLSIAPYSTKILYTKFSRAGSRPTPSFPRFTQNRRREIKKIIP